MDMNILIWLKNLLPVKHDFDLEHPLRDTVKTTHEHSNGIIDTHTRTYEGFICTKCDKVVWLDLKYMKNLPHKMQYGCKKGEINVNR